MPTKISSREVLTYLNHLGYNNVNPQQLKEFVRDLKKLIKYEERKREGEDTNENTTSIQQHLGITEENAEILSTLCEHTIASKAKITSKKESVISVQIKKNKVQICPEHNKENIISPKNSKSQLSNKVDNKEPESLVKDNVPEKLESTTSQPHEPDSGGGDGKKVKTRKPNLKPTTSFIRPVIPMTNKSDPVALYHQYQAEWKKQKLPGETRRTDLRWAIREKMLSGPRVS